MHMVNNRGVGAMEAVIISFQPSMCMWAQTFKKLLINLESPDCPGRGIRAVRGYFSVAFGVCCADRRLHAELGSTALCDGLFMKRRHDIMK